MFVALMRIDKHLGLMCDAEGAIYAFKTSDEAAACFEKAYDRNHNRGYEASMSACINFIQFQPKILEVADVEAVAAMIGPGPYSHFSCHSIAGHMCILKSDNPNPELEKVWEAGRTPALISEETFKGDKR